MKPDQKLILQPFQIIELEDRVIVKRGVNQSVIPYKGAMLILTVIQKALLRSALTAEELAGLFSGPIRENVLRLIDHLYHKRFLCNLNEGESSQQQTVINKQTAQDIFYWQFNSHQKAISEKLNSQTWAFVGVNEINKRLISVICREKSQKILVVDDPSLRNIRFYDDQFNLKDPFWIREGVTIVDEETFRHQGKKVGVLIASSEFGSFYLINPWNRYAVEKKILFYPVILQNMTGYAGPLVIPEESACLECLTSRQNSNSTGFREKRLTEQFAFEGQDFVAYHNSMLNVLAEIGIFNLIKFKNNIHWEINTLCEINLLDNNITKHKLLKAPRCQVCSAISNEPLINIHKQLTSKESWDEIEQTVGYYE